MKPLGPADPRRVGQYQLLGKLGAGGMGSVYLARSARGRTVAVKLVQPELARQPEFRQRFAQEVDAARRIGKRWTAPVLDCDTEAATPWVATGYVAGPSLHEVVASGYGKLPERTLLALANGLAHSLRDIHGAGLVHRDLKPSNVLITIDGPRVIDFGIARALEQTGDGLTRTGSAVGSPGFMSPEQCRGEIVTGASDVFCLGSVLAFAATGRTPFGDVHSAMHVLMLRIVQDDKDLGDVPDRTREIIEHCLAQDPAERPTLERLLELTAEGDLWGEEHADEDPWLPGPLIARLGKHAVELLDSEDPLHAPPKPLASPAPAMPVSPPPMAAPASPPPPTQAPMMPPSGPPAGPPAGPPPGMMPGALPIAGVAGAPGGYPGPAPAGPPPSSPPPSSPLPSSPLPSPLPPSSPPPSPPAAGFGPPSPAPGGAEAFPATPTGDGAAGETAARAEAGDKAEDGDGDGGGENAAPMGTTAAHATEAAPAPDGNGNDNSGGGGGGGDDGDGHDGPAGPPATPAPPGTPAGPAPPTVADPRIPGMVPTEALPSPAPAQGTPEPAALQTVTAAVPPPGVFGPPTGFTAPVTAAGAAPPPARPPRRKWRWILAAAGTALVLGGGFLVAGQLIGDDDGEPGAGGKNPAGQQSSPDPTPQHEGEDDDDADNGDDADDRYPDDASDGLIDADYLGAWVGEVRDEDDKPIGTFRRIEIFQGDVGDVVAETWSVQQTYMCRSEAELVSFGRLMTLEATMTEKIGRNCGPPYRQQTLKAQPNGTLFWSYPASGLTAVMERSDHDLGEDAVPDDYLGVWEPTEDIGQLELDLAPGPEGTAVAFWTKEDDRSYCSWEQDLIVTDSSDDRMLVGPGRMTYSEPEGACEDAEVESLLLSVDGDTLYVTVMPDAEDWGSYTLDTVTFTRTS